MPKLFTQTSDASFFLWVLATIFLTRFLLLVTWSTRFMQIQQQDWWHHSYTGILLVLVACLVPAKYRRYLIAIGLALFIDESYFLHQYIGISECAGYWSTQAYLSILGSVLLLYVCLKYNVGKKLLGYRTKKLGKK